MSDTFADGTQSILSVLRPSGEGWRELPVDQAFSLGYPCRRFWHEQHSLMVMSAVEVANDGDGVDKGPEYHVSISKQLRGLKTTI